MLSIAQFLFSSYTAEDFSQGMVPTTVVPFPNRHFQRLLAQESVGLTINTIIAILVVSSVAFIYISIVSQASFL